MGIPAYPDVDFIDFTSTRRTPMYKRILIATEGSEFGGKALTHGLALAKALNVPIVVVTVTEAWSALELARIARLHNRNPIEHYEEMVTAAGNHILTHAADLAKSQGVSCETLHVRDSHPADGIIMAVRGRSAAGRCSPAATSRSARSRGSIDFHSVSGPE